MAEATPSMQQIFEQILQSKLTPELAKAVNGCFQFKITGAEASDWVMDLTRDSEWIRAGTDPAAKCTVTVGGEEWKQILQKTLDPTKAFFNGKLKVQGDIPLAVKLTTLLQFSDTPAKG